MSYPLPSSLDLVSVAVPTGRRGRSPALFRAALLPAPLMGIRPASPTFALIPFCADGSAWAPAPVILRRLTVSPAA